MSSRNILDSDVRGSSFSIRSGFAVRRSAFGVQNARNERRTKNVERRSIDARLIISPKRPNAAHLVTSERFTVTPFHRHPQRFAGIEFQITGKRLRLFRHVDFLHAVLQSVAASPLHGDSEQHPGGHAWSPRPFDFLLTDSETIGIAKRTTG